MLSLVTQERVNENFCEADLLVKPPNVPVMPNLDKFMEERNNANMNKESSGDVTDEWVVEESFLRELCSDTSIETNQIETEELEKETKN